MNEVHPLKDIIKLTIQHQKRLKELVGTVQMELLNQQNYMKILMVIFMLLNILENIQMLLKKKEKN